MELYLEEWLAGLVERLASLNYEALDGDDDLLHQVLAKVVAEILVELNAEALPESMLPAVLDRAAGEFLLQKKALGTLAGYDFEACYQEIAEGDTRVVFGLGRGSQTPEQRFEALLAYLIAAPEPHLAAWRRLRW